MLVWLFFSSIKQCLPEFNYLIFCSVCDPVIIGKGYSQLKDSKDINLIINQVEHEEWSSLAGK